MKRIKMLLPLIFTLVLFIPAQAQYTGPGSEIKFHTIKEVKDDAIKLDRKDTYVRVKGFIIERVNDEDYVFQDSTGKIRVEIEDKYFPGFHIDENTEVIITAEVDYDLLDGTELEVEKVIELADSTPE